MGVLISAAIALTSASPLVSADATALDPERIVAEPVVNAADRLDPALPPNIDVSAIALDDIQRVTLDASINSFRLEDTLTGSDRIGLPAGSGAMAAVSTESRPKDPGAFDQAVLAAHDKRISLIKTQIDQLRSTEAVPPAGMLDGLTARLRRAEAARAIAARRVSCCEAGPMIASGGPIEPYRPVEVAAEPLASASNSRVAPPQVRLAKLADQTASQTVQAREPTTLHASAMKAATPALAISHEASAITPDSGTGSIADLRFARAKLAEARHLLDGSATAPSSVEIATALAFPSPAGQLALALSLLIGICATMQTRKVAAPFFA
jgi:hypothetical protein